MMINWREENISNVSLLITRGVSPSYTEDGEGILVINQRCIRDNIVLFENCRRTDTAKRKIATHKYLQDFDILVNSTGVGTLGRVAQLKRPIESQITVDSHVTIVRPDVEIVDPSYLGLAMIGSQRQIESMAEGATGQTELSRTRLGELVISLPPLLTQEKIASILSAYDDLIENNNRRIKILEEMAQNIYREWFVHFRYPGHEDVPLVDSELGQIPQGWEVKKVEDLVNRERPGKLFSQKTVFEQGDVPVLDQGKSGIIGYHDEAPGVLASLDEPIIIFANHTCYQRIIMFPFSAIQNVLPFRPHPQILRNIYWLHWATKDLVTFNDYKGHWPEFMAKSLPVPPTNLSEQFGSIAEQIVRMSFRLGNINQNLRKTRDMLLPKLISGQLDVEELDIKV
ncbi:MAG: type I restriction endonuclease subunit S [Chloroflexi bacterium]|nr:type I restriction endonuclease subunit S [Chloroflexota bacterium]